MTASAELSKPFDKFSFYVFGRKLISLSTDCTKDMTFTFSVAKAIGYRAVIDLYNQAPKPQLQIKAAKTTRSRQQCQPGCQTSQSLQTRGSGFWGCLPGNVLNLVAPENFGSWFLLTQDWHRHGQSRKPTRATAIFKGINQFVSFVAVFSRSRAGVFRVVLGSKAAFKDRPHLSATKSLARFSWGSISRNLQILYSLFHIFLLSFINLTVWCSFFDTKGKNKNSPEERGVASVG